jgi:transposase
VEEIIDAAWEQIEPLPPENGRKGRRWGDHRTAVDGTLWKLRTGAPWRTVPERYGPWQACFDRCNRWRRDSTRDQLLEHAQTKSDAVDEVGWEVSVDDPVGRAHQHLAERRGGQEASR